MFCSSCGKPLQNQGSFCIHCGNATGIPVVVVPRPLTRTANEQANHITAVAGRIGCNLLVGIIIFKIVVITGLVIACIFLAWSLGIIK